MDYKTEINNKMKNARRIMNEENNRVFISLYRTEVMEFINEIAY